jgi:hypothetical protein
VNPFDCIDKFIGRLLYRYLVKNDTKAFLKVGFSEPEALAKIVYNNRSKTWKSYGVGLKEITPIVENVCKIRPLKGCKLRIAMYRARTTIRGAIKNKRVVFLNENKVEYSDKGFNHCEMSFDELADKFIEVTKQGFDKSHIVSILKEEYKKRRG